MKGEYFSKSLISRNFSDNKAFKKKIVKSIYSQKVIWRNLWKIFALWFNFTEKCVFLQYLNNTVNHTYYIWLASTLLREIPTYVTGKFETTCLPEKWIVGWWKHEFRVLTDYFTVVMKMIFTKNKSLHFLCKNV